MLRYPNYSLYNKNEWAVLTKQTNVKTKETFITWFANSDENSLSWICLPIAGLKGIPSFIFCALCVYMPVNKRKFEGVLSPKKGEQNDIQATEVY